MAGLPESSVDLILVDPPYGLSFMGKEWDTIEPNRTKQRWSGGDRKLVGDGSGKGGNFGQRLGEVPTDRPKRNPQCRLCGHYQFSGTPCKCESPDWDLRAAEHGVLMQEWHAEWLREAYRLLRVGGRAKVFSGTRTFHRLAAAMIDVGFANLTLEAWGYGSGFPKSLNVSKAIDRMLGVERPVLGKHPNPLTKSGSDRYQWNVGEVERTSPDITGPGSDEAKLWDGWGTALKPAWEPFLVGTKL